MGNHITPLLNTLPKLSIPTEGKSEEFEEDSRHYMM